MAHALRWLVLVAVCFSGPSGARADDLATASTAFRQAQALQLRGDHEAAADAFLLADSIAPTPQAIRGAISNLVSAGKAARAATLALDARRRYPGDSATERTVSKVLADAASLMQVSISCSDACTVSLPDRAIFSEPRNDVRFYLVPGSHELEVRFATGSVTSKIEGAAGSKVEQRVEAPAAEGSVYAPPVFQPEPKPAPISAAPPPPSAPRETPRRGLHQAYFWSGVGLTAVLGGVTLWSGLSTMSRNDAYEDAPTKAKYNQVASRQALTNAMIGVTAGSAIATTVIGFFTRWPSKDRGTRGTATRASVWVDGHSAQLSLAGSFAAW